MTPAAWDAVIAANLCRGASASAGGGAMVHPGLPQAWGMAVWAVMGLATVWTFASGLGAAARAPAGLADGAGRRFVGTAGPPARSYWRVSLAQLPGLGGAVRYLTAHVWPLVTLRLLMAGIFLLVIAAGLWGTPLPERNLATVLTWNIWWTGLILAVAVSGSAWCAICPWDSLASWLATRRLWRRAPPWTSLGLRLPRQLRSVWPALALFVGLTWLELGLGITQSPYETALLALAMLVMATAAMVLFERKAFCQHMCPVGRTVGFYAQLAPVELRPVAEDVCARCTSLECYHGTREVPPCPTFQVMGRMTQNTYCTSCGNCARACPHENVAWRLRPLSAEAVQSARPHWDEAWFMLSLLALTGFHGLTMMPFWEGWISQLARLIGESGRLLVSFSISLGAAMVLPAALYAGAVWATERLAGGRRGFRRAFTQLAFTALPLAFAYHLAHNLGHLMRESGTVGEVLANPFGIDTLPLGAAARHGRMAGVPLTQDAVFALQAALLALGFVIALRVIRRRGVAVVGEGRGGWGLLALAPMILFAIAATGWHLWMLMQPMVMRM